jgi:hypothetical protein
LDRTVIKEHETQIKLEAVEEKMKAQEQQLKLAQKVLSKREFSSSTVISSVVANTVALMKNHMPNFDVEILRRDFTIDEGEREALVKSSYDIATTLSLSMTSLYFLSQMTLPVLALCNTFICKL